jgi:radical SAM superfamily enzyme YgiQ (UPF0313 family)
MSSRILLISVNRCKTPYPVFPLGLCYVAGALSKAGHAVEILDVNCDDGRIASAIGSFKPDYIGLSLRNIDDVNIRTRRTYIADLCDMAGIVKKETAAPVIAGGSGFSLFPERLLEDCGADFGVHGEGERAIVDLIDALERSILYPEWCTAKTA